MKKLTTALSILTAATFFCQPAMALECFTAKYPGAEPKAAAYVDGRQFFATYVNRKGAVTHAKASGLCVEDYGLQIQTIDPASKKAKTWYKRTGYSVWE